MGCLDDQFLKTGVGVSHHFGGGVYAKETHIPAGVMLTQHSHPFDHLSVLVSGMVVVEVEGLRSVHHGYECLTIEAHKAHSVTAVSDAVWLCIHATECTDPAMVDSAILSAAP